MSKLRPESLTKGTRSRAGRGEAYWEPFEVSRGCDESAASPYSRGTCRARPGSRLSGTARGMASLVCLGLCLAASGPQSPPLFYHPTFSGIAGAGGMPSSEWAYQAPRRYIGKVMPGSLEHLAMGLEEVQRAEARDQHSQRAFVADGAEQECTAPHSRRSRLPCPARS